MLYYRADKCKEKFSRIDDLMNDLSFRATDFEINVMTHITDLDDNRIDVREPNPTPRWDWKSGRLQMGLEK
jgi:hypothetical protein